MSGFYVTITTEDEEQLWNVDEAPAVPAVGEVVNVSDRHPETHRVTILEFRVLRREWNWQQHNRTFSATVYVRPLPRTPDD